MADGGSGGMLGALLAGGGACDVPGGRGGRPAMLMPAICEVGWGDWEAEGSVLLVVVDCQGALSTG